MTDDATERELNAIATDDEGGEDYRAPATVLLGADDWHGGAGWYYYWTEYPDEGSVGPFATRSEAVAHLVASDGFDDAEDE